MQVLSLDISRPVQRAILLSYVVVFLLGVPVWWSLTKVERYALPLTEIEQFDSAKVIPVSLAFRLAKPQECEQAPNRLTKINRKDFEARVNGRLQSTLAHQQGLVPLSQYPGWSLDVQFHAYDEIVGEPLCIENPSNVGPQLVAESDGQLRVYASDEDEAVNRLADYLAHLGKMISSPPQYTKFSRQYEILLSLMVQDPKDVLEQGYTPTWTVRPAIQRHLVPFLDKLLATSVEQPHAPRPVYKISSQAQYMAQPGAGVDLPARALGSRDPAKRAPVQPVHVPSNQLRLFVNPDWNLAAVTANHSVTHLITYVPSSRTPMSVLDDAGNPSSANDFVVPRWGGVVLVNVPERKEKEPGVSKLAPPQLPLDYEQLSEVWVTHLREVFGVIPLVGDVAVSRATTVRFARPLDGLHAVEQQVYHAAEAARHVAETSRTLTALVRMTSNLETLPIGPRIAGLVQDALKYGERARAPSANATERFLDGRAARILAEAAFFDKDMVALVYFPDEHKYAVYMPLFVPAIVTLLGAVYQEVMASRRRKK